MVKATLSVLATDAAQATLRLSDSSLPLANGILRAAMADVETVGFDGAQDSGLMVIKNEGALHNPMTLDRIGEVPIHMTAAETDAHRREMYVFEIHAKCAKDATGLLDVTSRDFRVFDADGKDLGQALAHRFFPVDPVTKGAILITQLRRGEELHVKGHSVKASGRKRASFCPVSRCSLVHSDAEGTTQKKGEDAKDEPTDFTITLRSECALTPKEIVVRALMSLRARVTGAAAAVDAGVSGDVTDAPKIVAIKFDTGATLHEVRFLTGEDSTLGELLQLHLLRVVPAFAGYDIPHNLDELLVVRFDAMGKDPATVFADACKGAIAEIGATLAAVGKA